MLACMAVYYWYRFEEMADEPSPIIHRIAQVLRWFSTRPSGRIRRGLDKGWYLGMGLALFLVLISPRLNADIVGRALTVLVVCGIGFCFYHGLRQRHWTRLQYFLADALLLACLFGLGYWVWPRAITIDPDRIPLSDGVWLNETTAFLTNKGDLPSYSVWLEIASSSRLVAPDTFNVEFDDAQATERPSSIPDISILGDTLLLPGVRNGRNVVFVVITVMPPHKSIPLRISGTLRRRADALLSIISASSKPAGFTKIQGQSGFEFVSPNETVHIRGVGMRLKKRSQSSR